jgi:serine phosphatase RsbU (regulator of sigma subunit)
MNRRRSHLEMLACALLVTALAVQPALGEGKRKDKRVPATAAMLTRAKQAGHPSKARVRITVRAAQATAPSAPIADPAPPPPAEATPPTSDPGETAPVDPIAGVAPPEQGVLETTPSLQQPAPADVPAAPAPPTIEDTSGNRDPVIPDTARSGPSNGGTTQAAVPTAETPQNGALAVAATTPPDGVPGTLELGTGPVGAPPVATGASPHPADTRSGTTNAPSRPPTQAARRGGTSPASSRSGTAIPMSALQAPLVTPATEAITRVRSGNRSETSQPRPSAGDTVPALQGTAETGASDSSVGETLVSWAKYALAVLALLVLALGANAIVAAARTRRLERQRERLMEDIGLLQAALLPAVPARLGALLTTVAYRPADGPAAGGDFYDAFALPDGRVGLLLGDVSGHGRQALAKTTLVRFTVRAHLEAGLSPREALAISGRSLDGRLSDDFATVIAAIHDPVNGTLTYASAGHPPPIVVGPSRHRPVTVSSAPPIGVGFPTGQRQTVLPMPEGASVMIYSDGLLEARVDGVPLGPERLAEWLRELGPDATAKEMLDRVVEHADRVPDDLAAVLLHAAPGATAPAARIEQVKLDVLDVDGPDLEAFLTAAGVSDVHRLIAGRRVSELLATTSGVIVEVRTGEHPTVGVVPIGDDTGISSVRSSARAR